MRSRAHALARTGVPQLLLRGSERATGAPLRAEAVLSDLSRFSTAAAAAAHAAADEAALSARWTMLTPWEHPHTGEARGCVWPWLRAVASPEASCPLRIALRPC